MLKEREFKVIWDFMKLWTLLYWNYLRPTEVKIVEFVQRTRGEARQITWRLSSRRHWVTSVETRGGRESRQRSNCTTTLVKWSDPGDLLEVKSETTTIAGGIVSSIELFRTLNTGPGVVGGQRTSVNRDKLFNSRPAVHSPFIVFRLNGASTCIIV